MQSNRIVFLQGRRTRLCLPMIEDAPMIARWLNSPAVREFISTMRPNTVASEVEWIQSLTQQGNEVVLLIETNDGVPIGMMGLHRIDPVHRTATTGAFIGEPSYWGKGYGQDAKMTLLEYAFRTLNLRKISSEVYAFNRRSIAYNRRCGYRVEGRLKRHFFRRGRYHDKVLLCVFREWWDVKWRIWKRTGRL
jgi:UDP-4-amino-4,6-dideoxy-N-acetyl-beta-L-altrosamine N-acetyltransferase